MALLNYVGTAPPSKFYVDHTEHNFVDNKAKNECMSQEVGKKRKFELIDLVTAVRVSGGLH
jgi:hypothetical protein